MRNRVAVSLSSLSGLYLVYVQSYDEDSIVVVVASSKETVENRSKLFVLTLLFLRLEFTPTHES